MGNEVNIFNVSSSRSYSVGDLASKVCKAFEVPEDAIVGSSSEGIEMDRILSNEKIREKLGWVPKYSIDDGILDAVRKLRTS